MQFRRRVGAAGVSVALVGGLFATMVANAPSAAASTTQNNGCLGVTGTFSQFAVPITGTAAPNPDTLPNTITLSGTSVTITVDSTLIGAGVTTGLVSAADNLADIGVTKNDGSASALAGIDAVVAAAGAVTLKIDGSNTVEGSQTATNPAAANTTFYVTADALGGSVVVYTALSSPPAATPVPGRTGTVLVGSLAVGIPLGNTTWTPTGGNVSFVEHNSVPSNLTVPTAADQLAAPLIILPKINGSISTPFHCWPGTVNPPPATNQPLIPGASLAIDTVTVVAPPTAPVCATPQSASVGGGQAVQVTPNCTDVNNPGPTGADFTPSNTSITLIGANGGAAHGTVTVGATGVLTYSNDGLGASTDSFQYHATDATALVSNAVTVNVSVLNNQCTASPTCSLRQVLIVPVLPSTLAMSEAALGGPGNPTFSQAILGGVLSGTTCAPGPLQLNGQPQTACGALNPLTIVNARGTDAKWDVTGQVTDFIDNTRGPSDTCSSVKNIAQTPPDNHCIPGDNLGWVPTGAIVDSSVPGDTAAVIAGGIILPPNTTAQVPPAFPPSILSARTNSNSVLPPYSILNLSTPGPGLHDVAQELCGAPTNQSGGTYLCNAGLLLAVPGSAAAGTYFATITLTLS